MNYDLTIVIPCKNEGIQIVNVVELVLSQIDSKIIIADSSDEPESISLLRQLSLSHPNVKIIQGGIPSVARNNGAKLVNTPYILFLDADIYVYNPFLIYGCVSSAIQKNYDLVTNLIDGYFVFLILHNGLVRLLNLLLWEVLCYLKQKRLTN
jgi:glycosyltransferase involved in cell wall biosynthesis